MAQGHRVNRPANTEPKVQVRIHRQEFSGGGRVMPKQVDY